MCGIQRENLRLRFADVVGDVLVAVLLASVTAGKAAALAPPSATAATSTAATTPSLFVPSAFARLTAGSGFAAFSLGGRFTIFVCVGFCR